MPSTQPPDKFQREIDDIIRLAERRLEHQSFRYRVRRSTRKIGSVFGGFSVRLPAAETLGGWGLALLLVSWLLTLPIVNGVFLARILSPWALMFGVLLLTLALITSLVRGRGGPASGGGGGGGGKMWRGERVSYGNPYGQGLLSRLRRMFRGR
ncbi:MAG TPA: hypothetical protein VGQ62_18275 [Chloroflexota bacterium]|jgi:hypothetical protein|nr:hypothetical protein [Chloroflexota bacterium]